MDSNVDSVSAICREAIFAQPVSSHRVRSKTHPVSGIQGSWWKPFMSWISVQHIQYLRTMVLVYRNLQNWVILDKGFFVGVHIPALWWANLGYTVYFPNQTQNNSGNVNRYNSRMNGNLSLLPMGTLVRPAPFGELTDFPRWDPESDKQHKLGMDGMDKKLYSRAIPLAWM